MNKISFIKVLAIVSTFWSMHVGFAQAVCSVPTGCTVVVAGAGGTLGSSPTGRVGNGGVVIMPDPSGGGMFNFTVAGVATTASWALRGDLSTTVVAGTNPLYDGNYNGATQSTTGSSANIITYNKDLRTESTERFNPSWARSKGQVTVNWTSPPCNNTITFDVFKTFSSIPNIVGPTCLQPGIQYTFSVDQIASDNANDNIGFDKYYWSGIPAGITGLYYSADNSSITFTMGGTVPSSTSLKCCVGRFNTTANADGGNGPNPTGGVFYSTCTTNILTPITPAPLYLSPPPTCHPTGTASFNIVYPNAVPPLVYTWTAPNTGWTINTPPVVGATNTTVTVNTPNNNPGLLTLTITGSPCGPIPPINYQVNRSLTGTSLIVPNTTLPGSTCMTAGSTNNQFFLGANASANTVTWTVTSPTPGAAANIVLSTPSGQPSSTVNVAIGTNAPVNATYTLTATANTTPACNATSATYTFNVRPQTPVITSGASCVVKGALTAQTYTCTNIPGASYNWVFPGGWTRVGGFTTTTNSITVTPANATAVLNGNVTVVATGVGTCNSSTSAPFAINYSPIAPSTLTFSNTCYNFGLATSGTITIANRPSPFYGNYTVTSSPAGLFSSVSVNSSTGIISFTTAASASGSYVITITHTTPTCGNAQTVYTSTPIVISSNGSTIPAPTLDPTVGECDTYTVTNRPPGSNASNTQWFVNGSPVTSNGSTVFISPSASQLQLCGANTTITSVCVQVTLNGCITRVCAPNVGTHGTARLSNPNGNNIKVYPNPNDGNFNILVNEVKKSASATVTDMTGKLLGTYELTKGENKIKNKNLSSGTYIVVIDIDGKQESQRIIIK